MTSVDQLLTSRSLRKTQHRSSILRLFLQNAIAMSERDIEDHLDGSCDRVTIYRTLHTFLEKGLVHKVLDSKGSTKYALCQHECEANGKHYHNHVHFSCQNCKQTLCIQQVQMPVVDLPPGFQVNEINVLYEGLCPNCKAQ